MEKKKQKKKDEDLRLKKYYEEKVKGKKSILEVWTHCKDDFVKWAEKKPVMVQNVAGFVEKKMDYFSEFHWDGTPRNATSEAEGTEHEMSDASMKNETNVDADLEEMGLLNTEEKEVIEVDQAILDSIFGDEDDDEEEEDEEQ
jgi:hypothetical protein